MNYAQALDYLEEAGRFGSIPGLETIEELCRRLGDPQEELSVIHIAGTNGKGSVLAYISAILSEAGYRTGRYSSPAVNDYRERFCVDGKPISKKLFAECVSETAVAADSMEQEGFRHPTVFEMETAAAFLFFRKKNCELVVLETGMGGLLDATNLIQKPLMSVITSVSMDHMQFLGKSLTAIAEQKAGIIKPGRPLVCAGQQEEVLAVFKRICKERESEIFVADASQAAKIKFGAEKQSFSYGGYDRLQIRLAGSFQIENAVLAVEVIKELCKLGYPVSEDALRKGLLEASWPGRFMTVGKKPLFIVDGAHNEDAARKLAESLTTYYTDKELILIMGVLRDKEYEKMIAHLTPLARQVITVTTPGNPRALSAYELAQAVREVQPQVTASDSLEEAVEMAYLLAEPETVIVACGSLSYLGELTQIVEKRQEKTKGRKQKNQAGV